MREVPGHAGHHRPPLPHRRDGDDPPSKDVDALCAMAKHKKVMVKVGAFYALGKKKPPYTDLAPLIRRSSRRSARSAACGRATARSRCRASTRTRTSIDLVAKKLDFLSDDDREWLLRKTAEKFFFSK